MENKEIKQWLTKQQEQGLVDIRISLKDGQEMSREAIMEVIAMDEVADDFVPPEPVAFLPESVERLFNQVSIG